MRRQHVDLSYSDKTKNILADNFESWQIISKDKRDPFARFINKLVAFNNDILNELNYIENMFFIDNINLNEEYVLYTLNIEDLQFQLPFPIKKAKSLDDLLDGMYDVANVYENRYIPFNLIENSLDIISNNNIIYFLHEDKLYNFNIDTKKINNQFTNKIIVNNKYVNIDSNNNKIIIYDTDDINLNTIKIKLNDININSFNIIHIVNYNYEAKYDINNDGVIDEYENNIFYNSIGLSTSELDPDEWDVVKWMDLDKDGIISENDYESFQFYYNSTVQNITDIIYINNDDVGQYELIYENNYNLPLEVIYNTDINIIYNNDIQFKSITYDNKNNIYYGVYNNELYAIVGNIYNPDNKKIIPIITDSKYEIIDTSIINGYLYVLVIENNNYLFYVQNIWDEYVTHISHKIIININSEFIPNKFILLNTGECILFSLNDYITLKFSRDKYIILDDVFYSNLKYNLYDENNNPTQLMYRHEIFNNMDALAYTFGITRPLGYDNYQLKLLIQDFYKHIQDNTKNGIIYGLNRELGFVNETIRTSTVYYLKYMVEDYNNFKINNEIYTYENEILTNGITSYIFKNNSEFHFTNEQLDNDDKLIVEFYTNDASGNKQYINEIIYINKTIIPDIKIFKMSDKDFLIENNLIDGNIPSEQLIDIILNDNDTDINICKNIILNSSVLDSKLISLNPIIPTMYNTPIVYNNDITELEI